MPRPSPLEGLVDRAPRAVGAVEVVRAVEAEVPAGFAAAVLDPILSGIESTVARL